MTANVNRVFLAGNLTRDPDIKHLTQTLARFALAVNRRWKDANGNLKDEATFVECEAWGRTAELIGQYLHKGSAAFIEGRLQLDTWQDKDGKNRSRLKVVADSVQFIGPKASAAPGAGTPAHQARNNIGRSESADPVAAGRMAEPTQPAGRAANDDEPPF